MPETFNPFQKWLGLSPQVKNPHHFQLLGVSTKLRKQKEIEEAVEAGARRQLELLAKVAPGEHDALLAQLKQRIALARKILIDPTSRAAYVAKLKAQIRARETSMTTQGGTGPGPVMPVAPPSKAPSPEAKNRSTGTPRDGGRVRNPASSVGPVPGPVESKPAIPLAVPLTPGRTTETSNTATPLIASAIPARPVQSSASAGDDPVEELKIDPKRVRKRKRSALGTVIAVVMLVMAGVGGFLIYQNFDSILKLGGVNPDAPLAPGLVTDKNEPNELQPNDDAPLENETGVAELDKSSATPANQPEETVRPLPEFDLNKLPELTESDVAKVRDSNDVQPDDVPSDDEMPDIDGMADGRDGESEMKEVSGQTIVRFDESELAEIRRDLQRARRSLFRREKNHARNAIDNAQDILDRVVTSEEFVIAPEQKPVARLIADTSEILDLIDGFWRQVVASSKSIPGGQEIRIGEQVVGFLEGDDDQVTVRNSGTNITYEYYFCPPGLATSLALQGAIADIPIWSKQLAAFYAVNAVDGIDHRQKIDELLKVAEDAGHDCSGIRHFADFQFGQIGKPEIPVLPPNGETVDEAVAAFRAESNYDDPEKLEPGMAGLHAEFLLQLGSPNFDQQVALLEEARRLAIQGGEASKLEDAILEMEIYAQIDAPDLMCKSLIELTKGKLIPEQRRPFMERSIAFLNSSNGQMADARDRKSLVSRLKKIAQSERMLDATRRLNQIQ